MLSDLAREAAHTSAQTRGPTFLKIQGMFDHLSLNNPLFREAYDYQCPPTLDALNVEGAAVKIDQCLGDRQAKTSSAEPAGELALKLLERLECLRNVLGCHSDARV